MWAWFEENLKSRWGARPHGPIYIIGRAAAVRAGHRWLFLCSSHHFSFSLVPLPPLLHDMSNDAGHWHSEDEDDDLPPLEAITRYLGGHRG